MEKFESRISHQFDLITIHKFNELSQTAHNKPRLCEIHNEPVTLNWHSHTANSFGAPDFEAVLIGCCKIAVDKEWKFINQTIENQQ